MKTLINGKNVLMIMAMAAITLFNSCKKDNDKCDGGCPTGQICQDGQCITGPNAADGTVTVNSFITTNQTWTSDRIYILDGRIVVRAGATLTIEPGTIIKGQNGTGTAASVLIIERGAKIDARGTAAKPIIFTSIEDNIKIGELAGTNFDEKVNEKWGGIIVLGNAPVSTENGDVTGQIEGIPSNETYGVYGGSNIADNSGVLQYISIRHGGITIGDGNEINGLTLGGVGNGTVIDHVEVVANLDDGIEFFGGSVDVSNAIVVYQGDDGIDIDQSYSGTVSNVMVISGNGIKTDEMIEIDGPEGASNTGGLFTITNGTFVSEGTDCYAGDLKSKAQGTVTLCQWIGNFNPARNGYLYVRASFSDTMACTPKSDAYLYMTQTNSKLKVFNNDFVGATIPLAFAYNNSGGNCIGGSEQTALQMLMNNINSTTAMGGRGADRSQFAAWTWASKKGKLSN